MILDAGCGNHPKGHVNTDIIRIPNVPNFVQCDAHFLPFRDNSFKVVHASHLLEHAHCPMKLLKEFRRVTKSVVYLHVPHGDKHPELGSVHLYSWTMKTLENLLKRVFYDVEVYTTERIAYKLMTMKYTNRTFMGISLLMFLRKLRHTILYRPQITAICYKK